MSNIINKIRLSGTDYTLSATTSGGVTSGEVETMISAATSGYTARFAEDEEVTARALNELNDAVSGKADTSAVTESINAAVSGKQDTLSAGTGIDITDNVISATGGSDINVVQSTGYSTSDVMSQDAVTYSINMLEQSIPHDYVNSISGEYDDEFFRFGTSNDYYYFMLGNAKINGRNVLNSQSATPNEYNLVETSAITTSISSGSTNTQVPSAKAMYDKFDEVEQVTARALNELNDAVSGKVDTSTFDTYSGNVETALSGKQDTLSAGTGIDITDNVISATGGGSITIDPSLDSGSTNAVANSAITTAINDRQLKKEYVASEKVFSSTDTVYGRTIYHPVFRCYSNNSTNTELVLNNKDLGLYFPSVNGKKIFSSSKTETDWLGDVIEASAITTTITSASTDSQVPSAKAVYDQLGGLKLVKLTQSAYDALSPNYDSNTLYVIVN